MSETVFAPRARRVPFRPDSGRRRFLKTALGALLALPAGWALAGEGPAATGLSATALAGTGPGFAPARPLARRAGDGFLVEGWVLTEADLRALGIAIPEPDPRRPEPGLIAGRGQGAEPADAL